MSEQARPRLRDYFRLGGGTPQSPRTLTAAATEIDLKNHNIIKKVVQAKQAWQEQAIDTINAVGELHYGLSTLAALGSRATLFAATLPDETDATPVRVTGKDEDERKAIATIDRLGSPVTRTDLQFDSLMNLFGPGECYLVCIGPRPERGIPDERWEIRSIREIETTGTSITILDRLDDTRVTLDPARGDTFIRIWRPDPFQHDKATSHVRAVLGACEELLWWDSAASAVARNRLTMAGLIGLPSNLEVPEEEDDPEGLEGIDRFIYRMMTTMMKAIQSPADAAAAVPILYSYPWNEHGKSGLDVTEMTRPQDELLEARTDRSLKRIEQGINLPAGVISGLGNATHWGGGQIEESLFRDHGEPALLLLCSALTTAYMHTTLRKAGVTNPQRFFVWYDASNLVVHRDKSQNAIRATELGLIGPPAARRELGYSERDKPTPDQLKQLQEHLRLSRGGQKEGVVENPSQPNEDPKSPTAAPQQNQPGQRTSEDEKTAASRGKGRPVMGSVDDRTITLARIQAMCDEKVRRALERAGNKLITRARKTPYKNSISGVRNTMVASVLGPQACGELEVNDVFDDAFDDLKERLYDYLGDANDAESAFQNLYPTLKQAAEKGLYHPPNGELLVSLDLIDQAVR